MTDRVARARSRNFELGQDTIKQKPSIALIGVRERHDCGRCQAGVQCSIRSMLQILEPYQA